MQPSATADGLEAFGLWRTGRAAGLGRRARRTFPRAVDGPAGRRVRPFVGRDPFYELGQERWNGGFPLLRQGETLGWIDLFDEDWAFGVNVLERFTRSPEALATPAGGGRPSRPRTGGTHSAATG